MMCGSMVVPRGLAEVRRFGQGDRELSLTMQHEQVGKRCRKEPHRHVQVFWKVCRENGEAVLLRLKNVERLVGHIHLHGFQKGGAGMGTRT